MKPKNVFLTGLPYVGKTTALLRIVRTLDSACGFVTRSVEENGKKSGLDIQTWDGELYRVAELNPLHRSRTGRYVLDTQNFDRIIDRIRTCSINTKYIYLDEIGTLYCQSELFKRTLLNWLTSHTVIGVIAQKGHPFVEDIHRRSDCTFIPVTSENRDSVPDQLLKLMT